MQNKHSYRTVAIAALFLVVALLSAITVQRAEAGLKGNDLSTVWIGTETATFRGQTVYEDRAMIAIRGDMSYRAKARGFGLNNASFGDLEQVGSSMLAFTPTKGNQMVLRIAFQDADTLVLVSVTGPREIASTYHLSRVD